MTDRESSILGVLGGPGRPGNLPKRWGAAQTPKIDDFRSVEKSCVKNPREIALELASGADFLCKLMCGAGPVDLRGYPAAWGRPDPQNRRFPVGQKIISKTQVYVLGGPEIVDADGSSIQPSELGDSHGLEQETSTATIRVHSAVARRGV